MIFRFIYNYVECRTSFRRLWISSLTDRAIREGMQALVREAITITCISPPAHAAKRIGSWASTPRKPSPFPPEAARGHWAGTNAHVGHDLLALPGEQGLYPANLFQAKGAYRTDATAFAVLSADKYDSRGVADQTAAIVKAAGELSVTSVVKKEVRQEPPLLYDLTTLQKDANKRHGFSADKTLTIAQGLYESKFISYPRTGSRYISVDVMEEIPHLIATLRAHPKFGGYIDARPDTRPGTRPVNDAKVTDHHALIITEDPARGLSEDQQLVYDMIAGRMLEAFGEGLASKRTPP